MLDKMQAADDSSLYGLYLHIPFCQHRCAYCDFFSTADRPQMLPSYLDALTHEAGMIGDAGGRPRVDTVYLGGGTPSLTDPARLAGLMDAIRARFRVDADAECTMEANPDTVTETSLAALADAGINRISLGMQSADEGELRLLGRIHTHKQTRDSVEAARRAGIGNISLDLMYGLPSQTIDGWRSTVQEALRLDPRHLSLYALTLERGTPLTRAVRRKALPQPDDDEAADMYAYAEDALAAAGFRQYEISNWAREDPEGDSRFPHNASRHNIRYWMNQLYLGFGAGAHGCAAGQRYAVIRSVSEYIARIERGKAARFPLSPAVSVRRRRTREDAMRETMWLGLRLTETGVDRREFVMRFGEWPEAFDEAVRLSVAEGLLEVVEPGERIRLTRRGRLLGNVVFRRFV